MAPRRNFPHGSNRRKPYPFVILTNKSEIGQAFAVLGDYFETPLVEIYLEEHFLAVPQGALNPKRHTHTPIGDPQLRLPHPLAPPGGGRSLRRHLPVAPSLSSPSPEKQKLCPLPSNKNSGKCWETIQTKGQLLPLNAVQYFAGGNLDGYSCDSLRIH